MSERFAEQVVVVTGSATGIGSASAIRFASEGARVACLDINADDNAATTSTVRSHGVDGLAPVSYTHLTLPTIYSV